MFTETQRAERHLSVSRPDPNDPTQQTAEALKDIIETMMKSNDFKLNLNLEGRTLSNGDRELIGGFTFILPKESEQD